MKMTRSPSHATCLRQPAMPRVSASKKRKAQSEHGSNKLLRKNQEELRKRVVQDELLAAAGRAGNLAKHGENDAKLTRACDYIMSFLDDTLQLKRTQQEGTQATSVLYGPDGPASVGIGEDFLAVGVNVASCETIFKNNGVTDCVRFLRTNTSAGLLVLAAALLRPSGIIRVYAFPGTVLAKPKRGRSAYIALDLSKSYSLKKWEISPSEIPAALQAVLAHTAYTSLLSGEVLWTAAQARDYFIFKPVKFWRIPVGDKMKKEHFTSDAIRAVLPMSPPLQEHSVVDFMLEPAVLAFLKATYPLLANLEGPNVQAKTACINGTKPGLYVHLEKMAGTIKEGRVTRYHEPYNAADFDALVVLSVKAEEGIASVERYDVRGIFIIPIAALKAHKLVDFTTAHGRRIVGKKSMCVWPPQTPASRALYGHGEAARAPYMIDRHGTVVDWETGELTAGPADKAKEHWTTQYYISMGDLKRKKSDAGVAF